MVTPLTLQMHVEHENESWTVNIPDHPARKESSGFKASKKVAKAIMSTLGVEQHFLGVGDIHMHHGGSLWLLDDDGWFMVHNQAGIEWSAQFCTDPAKADALRVTAGRLYAGFPRTVPELDRLGYTNARRILDTPITDAATIATWVDSIFNACVPLPAVRHVAMLPTGGGRHHYPAPITDIDLVKHDDFVLWVTDPDSGSSVAVVPIAARGKGVTRVQVLFATPGTALAEQRDEASARGEALELGPESRITMQAFARQ